MLSKKNTSAHCSWLNNLCNIKNDSFTGYFNLYSEDYAVILHLIIIFLYVPENVFGLHTQRFWPTNWETIDCV